MKIRKAKKGDEKELGELFKQFWEVHKNIDPILVPAKKLASKDYVQQAKESIKENGKYLFVAVESGKIVGFIDFYIKKNDKFFKVKKYGYLDSVVTHKDYRRKGIARGLTKFAINFLKKKGIRYVRAKVDNSNKIALQAWVKIGFKSKNTGLLMRLG